MASLVFSGVAQFFTLTASAVFIILSSRTLLAASEPNGILNTGRKETQRGNRTGCQSCK
jgi:hypothetical protein